MNGLRALLRRFYIPVTLTWNASAWLLRKCHERISLERDGDGRRDMAYHPQ